MKVDKKEILRELAELESRLVVVEGKKDKKALEKFGLKRIMTLEGKPLYETIENIDEKVAILTDLDSKGKELYSKLKKGLTRRGIKTDEKLRHLLLKSDLKVIEGIDTYLSKE